MNTGTKTKNIILAALFLALGMTLPLVTMQIKEIGDSLLPMHFVIMLCGLICGPQYGLICGFLLPFLRSAIFGMPPLYPNAIWMSAELLTYGFVVGYLYKNFFKKQIWWLYLCLIISMLSGRIVWGITKTLLLTASGNAFTFGAFLTGGFLDAVPGIIIQLVLIPIIITIINERSKPQ